MDENQYCDSKFVPPDTRIVDGVEYRLIGRRSSEKAANAIRDDLVGNNKRAIVTKEEEEFAVWWC
jgi:hypothetical protein